MSRISVEECRTTWGLPPDSTCVLFVGRLVREKQPIKALDVLEKLLESNSNTQLIIVGDGILKNALLTEVQDRQLGKHVSYFSNIPNSQMWMMYRAADVFINLNTHEIFGMSILESMYYRTPVVALKAPGPNYIIEDSVSGYLCDDIDQIILNVRRLISSENVRMKDTAHTRILKRFTWEVLAKQVSTILNNSH